MKAAVEIPDLVRFKLDAMGNAGAAWLNDLPGTLSRLSSEWGLTIEGSLTGGTEAIVLEARMSDGRKAALKVPLEGAGSIESQRRVLAVARGRAYAELYPHDAISGALLLERLGARLDDSGLSVERQIRAICNTLQLGWQISLEGVELISGRAKADWYFENISRLQLKLGGPLKPDIISKALDFARARREAHHEEAAVLVHGDAHSWNTLADPDGGWKFVDPDGLIAESAFDLSILMRGWTAELLAGDPVELGLARCRLLAGLGGADQGAIWQWGFVERVSSGLLWLDLGNQQMAEKDLAVLAAWAGVKCP